LVINEKIKQEKYEESKKDLLKLKSIYENNSNDEENLLKTYQYLASVYGYLKVPDSTNYFISKSNKIQIAILDATVIKQTNELETKYQTTKKEKQIIQQQAEVKKRNLYLVGLSGLILLLGIIAYLINRQQKQKLAQQEQEYQLKNAISQIETQNKLQEQRLSISRDLHDNIGAQLTFIISSVDNVKYAFDITNEKLDQKLTNISSFAKETILELRDTIWAMNHNEISYEDLEIRINNYIEKAKQSKDQISFSFAIEDVLKTKRLTSVEGMNIYRTIQEAINNAIKYANASIISVNVKEQDGQTKITISDNGSGFDTETTESGNGLQNMKKRIEEIGGKFVLSSSIEGTKIEVLV
jgi:signal transduction histidine kinase